MGARQRTKKTMDEAVLDWPGQAALAPVAGEFAQCALLIMRTEQEAGRLEVSHGDNGVWMAQIPDSELPDGDLLSTCEYCVKWLPDLPVRPEDVALITTRREGDGCYYFAAGLPSENRK